MHNPSPVEKQLVKRPAHVLIETGKVHLLGYIMLGLEYLAGVRVTDNIVALKFKAGLLTKEHTLEQR